MTGTYAGVRWWGRGLAAALVCVGLLGAPARAQGRDSRDVPAKDSSKFLGAFRAAVAPVAESTVRVQCEGKDVALGAVVGADGWIVTKASLLKGTPKCKLRDGRELEGKVVGVHEPYDLAVLKFEANGLTPVAWADSKTAAPGSWVATPGMDECPVAVGVVSVPTRSLAVREAGPPFPSKAGFLGIQLEDGTKILEITPRSAAAKAGLQRGDRILAVSGKPTEDTDTLRHYLQWTKAGEVVTLKIKRGDEELELKATLDKIPVVRGAFQNGLGSKLSERAGAFPLILQHDTVVDPKDCGGPLVDLDGKVVGINIARAGRVESYAIPAEAVQAVLGDLKAGKNVPLEQEDLAKALLAKVAEAKAVVEKLEAEKAAAEKKLTEARAALEKLEAEAKAVKK
jgi:serine protease Do